MPPTPKPDWPRRLGYYLAGIAIGLVLMGVFQLNRTREAARRAHLPPGNIPDAVDVPPQPARGPVPGPVNPPRDPSKPQ